jgi:hypothetical protein
MMIKKNNVNSLNKYKFKNFKILKKLFFYSKIKINRQSSKLRIKLRKYSINTLRRRSYLKSYL